MFNLSIKGFSANNPDYFILTTTSKTDYYLNEMIEYNVKLYFTGNDILDYRIINTRSFPNFAVKNIKTNNHNLLVKYHNNIKYNVINIENYLLYPLKTGKFFISPPVLYLNIRSKFTSKRITDNSNIIVNILNHDEIITPKPSGTKGVLKISDISYNSDTKIKNNSNFIVSLKLSGIVSNEFTGEPKITNDDWIIVQKTTNDKNIIFNNNNNKYITMEFEYELRSIKVGTYYLGPFVFCYYNVKNKRYELLSTNKLKFNVFEKLTIASNEIANAPKQKKPTILTNRPNVNETKNIDDKHFNSNKNNIAYIDENMKETKNVDENDVHPKSVNQEPNFKVTKIQIIDKPDISKNLIFNNKISISIKITGVGDKNKIKILEINDNWTVLSQPLIKTINSNETKFEVLLNYTMKPAKLGKVFLGPFEFSYYCNNNEERKVRSNKYKYIVIDTITNIETTDKNIIPQLKTEYILIVISFLIIMSVILNGGIKSSGNKSYKNLPKIERQIVFNELVNKIYDKRDEFNIKGKTIFSGKEIFENFEGKNLKKLKKIVYNSDYKEIFPKDVLKNKGTHNKINKLDIYLLNRTYFNNWIIENTMKQIEKYNNDSKDKIIINEFLRISNKMLPQNTINFNEILGNILTESLGYNTNGFSRMKKYSRMHCEFNTTANKPNTAEFIIVFSLKNLPQEDEIKMNFKNKETGGIYELFNSCLIKEECTKFICGFKNENTLLFKYNSTNNKLIYSTENKYLSKFIIEFFLKNKNVTNAWFYYFTLPLNIIFSK